MAKTEFQQELSSASANAVYLLKTEDDTITGIVSLQNGVDTNTYLTNLQAHIYTVGEIIGIVGENDPNALVYTSTEFIQNGDNRKVCVEKLDAQAKLNSDNIAANLVLIGTNQTAVQAIIDSVGAADGICPLDANSKIPSQYLPDVLLQYQGTWDASTNTPTLSDATGELNHWYRCNVAGTQDLGSGNLTFEVGEKAVHNGTIWQKWDTVDTLISVFGRTGEVVAQAGDYTAAQVGLGNVTDDAQLKRESGDFNTFTEKATPVIDDIVLIEDSEDTFSKKKVKLANMLGGGGEGGINYVENSNFESDAVGHTAYKNTAGEVPTTGTGGTPTIVISRSTTDPLVGDASGLVEKGALDTQGEGINVTLKDFDNADKARIQIISFEYDASDANYVDGDYRVYFLDNTNSKVIRVNGEDIKGGKGTHYARVQVPIDCDNGSILIHCATTNANAIDFKYDRVSMAPQKIAYGGVKVQSILGNGGSRTTGGIVSNYTIQKENGSSLLVNSGGIWTCTRNNVVVTAGAWGAIQTADSRVLVQFIIDGTPYAAAQDSFDTGSGYSSSASASYTLNKGDQLVFRTAGNGNVNGYSVTFSAISQDNQTSEDFGGRDVVTKIQQTISQPIANATITKLSFQNVLTDTASQYNSTLDRIEIVESGYYDARGIVEISGGGGANRLTTLVYKNNIQYEFNRSVINPQGNSSCELTLIGEYFERGDYLDLRFSQESGVSKNTISNESTFSVVKRASSQQILETERVAARYTSDSGQSIPNNTDTTIVYEDKDYDTHNAYNASTGVYKVPVTGKYLISAKFIYAVTSMNIGTRGLATLFVNGQGRSFTSTYIINPAGLIEYFNQIVDILDLSEGDELEISTTQNLTGGSTNLSTISTGTNFSIARIK